MVAQLTCRNCGTPIPNDHPYSWCSKCGEPLSADIVAGLPALEGMRAARAAIPTEEPASASRSASSPQAGIVIGVIGFLLLIFAAMQWNSVGSQIARGMGKTDSVSIFMFLAGAVGLIIGFGMAFSSSGVKSTEPVAAVRSVEGRIRELDDLRSKGLVTDAEYAERKKEIIASL